MDGAISYIQAWRRVSLGPYSQHKVGIYIYNMDNEYNNGSTAVSAVTLVVDFSEMQESINCIEDVN